MAKKKMKICGLNIDISKTNIKIKDAYKINNTKKMQSILEEVLEADTDYITNRSMTSLIQEWIAHNRLYKLHILRNRTKDCDFESHNPKFLLRIIYSILGKKFKGE